MDTQNFERLLSSIKEAKEIMNEQKEIRAKMSLTQDQFAALMNISVYTLRNWEQGRRHPEGPARVLLNVVNNHPEVLLEMV